jgi:N-acetyl-gamma-glutamyl-phosphate reductase
MFMGISAAVLGASGYAGGELVRLLDGHPHIELRYLGGHASEGRRLGDLHPQLSGGNRVFGGVALVGVPDVDLVFLALPHGASAAIAAGAAARGMTVIDLGSDMRLDNPERYRTAYGLEHPLPDELGRWEYGLPEVTGRPRAGSTRVAVPGCYPTAAVLALAPLLAAGIATARGVVVDAVSGVTGAGRSLQTELLFGEVAEGVRPYGLGGHRHRPEMEMALEAVAGSQVALSFTPHLAPIQRGLVATVTSPLARAVTGEDVLETLAAFYRERRFIEVMDRPPQTRWVSGSNRALITAAVDEHAGTVIAVAAIDNLLKGAAGQAVQCANLALDLDEGAGLPVAGSMP